MFMYLDNALMLEWLPCAQAQIVEHDTSKSIIRGHHSKTRRPAG